MKAKILLLFIVLSFSSIALFLFFASQSQSTDSASNKKENKDATSLTAKNTTPSTPEASSAEPVNETETAAADIDIEPKEPKGNPATEGMANERGAGIPHKHLAVFEDYCFDCHDSLSEKGNINLETLSFNVAKNIETAELWDDVLNVVNSGEMPPKKKAQIPDELKLDFLKDLSRAMVAARKVLSDSGGEITMRRLNRREYVNSIKALTGLEPDKEIYLLLPKDEDLEGFDTNGASLYFSSQQFELYRDIARDALTKLLRLDGMSKPQVQKVRTQVEDAAWDKISRDFKELENRKKAAEAHRRGEKTAHKFLDEKKVDRAFQEYKVFAPQLAHYLEQKENKSGQTLTIGQYYHGVAKSSEFTPWTGGRYIVRYKVAAKNDPTPYESYAHFSGAGLRKITASVWSPETITVETELQPSEQSTHFSVSVRDNLLRHQSWRRFRKALAENGRGPESHIWVDWIEYQGPYHEEWPPREVSALLLEKQPGEKHDKYVRRVIQQFAKRAFRDKEPAPSYVDLLMKIYYQHGGNAQTFKRAIIEPLSIVLASPSFIFLAEPRAGDEPQEITDRELAARLSYFLWSAPPDEELLSLARAGLLSEPKELRKQTERLLLDPRSIEFIRGFAYQWLGLVEVDTFEFSGEDFPHFDEDIRTAAKEEIYQTVYALFQHNGPLKKIVANNYIFVNDLLADYYGIKGVKGHEFRPVTVPRGSPRGGLLGMAALHILGSDGKEVNLVRRGAWVLTHILNDPPPPAPADVPQLSRLEDEGPLPARELLRLHMEEPQCAQCHLTIDPVGYGLQNFDAAGNWRNAAIHTAHHTGEKVSFPVNSSGTLPRDGSFNNFFEFRQQVANWSPYFTRGFIEALVAYSLGREYSIADFDFAHTLYKQAQNQGDTIRAYVHHLVQSPAFKSK